MKPLAIAVVIVALFVIEACASGGASHSRGMPALPPPPAAPAAAPVETAPPPPPPAATAPTPPPVSPPPPMPPAAPARTLGFTDGMERVSDADVEGSLERWADGKEEPDLDLVVKRVGVYVEVAAIIKWDENKKRARDPADHDRIARESTDQAIALVAAAKAGKRDEIKGLSDKLLATCVDCHTKYK